MWHSEIRFTIGMLPGRLLQDQAARSYHYCGRRFIWVEERCRERPGGLGGEFIHTFTLGPLTFRHQAASRTLDGVFADTIIPKPPFRPVVVRVSRLVSVADGRRLMMPAFRNLHRGTGRVRSRDREVVPAWRAVFLLGRDRLFSFRLSAARR